MGIYILTGSTKIFTKCRNYHVKPQFPFLFLIFVMAFSLLSTGGSMILSGISCFFLWFGTSESMMIGMLCLYNGLSISAWNSLDVVTVELYPTDRRWDNTNKIHAPVPTYNTYIVSFFFFPESRFCITCM